MATDRLAPARPTHDIRCPDHAHRQPPTVCHMTYELEERRMDVADLQVGMYVCRLDRPWEETPFPLQGLALASMDNIEALRRHCNYVYIDARRLVTDPQTQASVLVRSQVSTQRFDRSTTYASAVSVEAELPHAQKALDNAAAMLDRIYEDVTSGRELSAEHVEGAVRPLVASVLRNVDAFLWVDGLRTHDSYSYSHAISCSALAAAFGRHMGFAEETIISLAAGGLLMDVGKARLPRELLERPGPLSLHEMERVRSHVPEGLDILAHSRIVEPDVLDIVRHHHEHYDGSGYPEHLMGSRIPLPGRMLAIIDAYDAMVSPRPYRPAISRHAALRHIYAERERWFQAELVEQFQVCMGVYPTGSLVELSTGEIAIVMEQNQARRLRPRVVLLSTPQKQRVNDFQVIDLMNHEGPGGINIVRSLAPGSCPIDTSDLFLAA
ncbi:MAG TPA: HD-GYP domain-containing protein [Frateuria sp.]|uniref:HD-GYP domain-containing protein n=1 Tax=Frateuria sp. TaxID=2211372 RepID=UPI002D80752E|nr:HD-GYP domain-containing protein [Frateuria sp.]HET6804428.1 HD-GYP domain-containing protein [Frateuria sp.]